MAPLSNNAKTATIGRLVLGSAPLLVVIYLCLVFLVGVRGARKRPYTYSTRVSIPAQYFARVAPGRPIQHARCDAYTKREYPIWEQTPAPRNPTPSLVPGEGKLEIALAGCIGNNSKHQIGNYGPPRFQLPSRTGESLVIYEWTQLVASLDRANSVGQTLIVASALPEYESFDDGKDETEQMPDIANDIYYEDDDYLPRSPGLEPVLIDPKRTLSILPQPLLTRLIPLALDGDPNQGEIVRETALNSDSGGSDFEDDIQDTVNPWDVEVQPNPVIFPHYLKQPTPYRITIPRTPLVINLGNRASIGPEYLHEEVLSDNSEHASSTPELSGMSSVSSVSLRSTLLCLTPPPARQLSSESDPHGFISSLGMRHAEYDLLALGAWILLDGPVSRPEHDGDNMEPWLDLPIATEHSESIGGVDNYVHGATIGVQMVALRDEDFVNTSKPEDIPSTRCPSLVSPPHEEAVTGDDGVSENSSHRLSSSLPPANQAWNPLESTDDSSLLGSQPNDQLQPGLEVLEPPTPLLATTRISSDLHSVRSDGTIAAIASATPDDSSTISHRLLSSRHGPEQLFRCTMCMLDFLTRGQLNNHVKRKHIRRFKCSLCTFKSHLKTCLERHKHSVHRDIYQSGKKYLYQCPNIGCSKSGKEFNRKDNFERHLRTCKVKRNLRAT